MDRKEAGNYLILLAFAALFGLLVGLVIPRTDDKLYENAGLCPSFGESTLLKNFEKSRPEIAQEVQKLAVSNNEPEFCSYLEDTAKKLECERAVSETALPIPQ
jgi:hypothetical protein